MKLKTALILTFIGATSALAAQTPVPVTSFKSDLKTADTTVTDKKFEFRPNHLAFTKKEAGIKITTNVVDANGKKLSASPEHIKCLNAQAARVGNLENIKKRWPDTVKYLNSLGIYQVNLTVREFDTEAGAPQVSAYVQDPDKLQVQINFFKAQHSCQAVQPRTDLDPAELLKNPHKTGEHASVNTNGEKSVFDVVQEWSDKKAGIKGHNAH